MRPWRATAWPRPCPVPDQPSPPGPRPGGDAADAAAPIAGYAVSNDVSERAFQLEESGGQWPKGRSCATFNPLGPVLVTADEADDLGLGRQRSGCRPA